MTLKPIIKWAGGKSRMIQHLTNNIKEINGTYYEPFVGGGALFLYLKPKKWVINDTNKQLIDMWIQIRDSPNRLYEELNILVNAYLGSENKKDFYMTKRELFNDSPTPSLFIFLNKTCFNGLYRVNKSGKFNVPWNKNQDPHFPSLEHIMSISMYMNTTEGEIRCTDWEQAISDIEPNDFIYLDPPYYPKNSTSFTTYTKDNFTIEDQKKLSVRISELKNIDIMLSNSNVPKVLELYSSFIIQEIPLSRSINSDKDKRKKTACELIITNWFVDN